MAQKIIDSQVLFEVEDKFGKKIRTSKPYWDYILEVKHREAQGKLTIPFVIECIRNPDQVEPTQESSVLKYYKHNPDSGFTTCVVIRHLNGDGFVITCYISNKIK